MTESEERLRVEEAMYRTIFENMGTATIIGEGDTTICRADTRFQRLSGYPKGELEGKRSWTEFTRKKDPEKMLR